MQSHCTVWHLLSALAPASPWTVAHVARCSQGHSPTLWHLRHQDSISPDACKGIEIELSEILLPLALSLWSPSGLFILLLPVPLTIGGSFLISTWIRTACHWVCGTGHWGCACLAGTCRGTGLCCWELPTRCRCCRRADLKSALHNNCGLQWEEEEDEEDQCKWKESGFSIFKVRQIYESKYLPSPCQG